MIFIGGIKNIFSCYINNNIYHDILPTPRRSSHVLYYGSHPYSLLAVCLLLSHCLISFLLSHAPVCGIILVHEFHIPFYHSEW